MLRAKYLLGCCFSATLLHISPAFGQPDGEWRPMLPEPVHQLDDDRDTATNSPELLRTETKTANEVGDEARPEKSVRIGSVLVEAKPAVDHAMFEATIEPFLGTDATEQDLAKLAQQIADVARSQGMVLARAYVPRQQVEMGIVKIVLQVGIIDEVRIDGSSNRALRRLLDELVGKALLKGELERRLVLASSIPQITVGRTELLVEGGRQILLVKVNERKKIRGKLQIDNYGSRNIGPYRARLSVEGVALLDDSDYMNVTFRTNPVEPEELVAASITYGIGLNSNGTRAEIAVAASGSEIDPGRFPATRDARSQYASLAINHPLRRSRTSNLWVEGQFEYLKIEQESLGALLQSDTVVTMSLSLSSSLKLGNGWLRSGVQLRQGLDVFGANRRNDPFQSRSDSDGQYTSARIWTNWSGKPVGDMTLRMAVSGQLATQALLSSEELGLGGAFVGRGFNFFERSGDQGILALIELGHEYDRPASWLRKLQPYVFVDGGYVDNFEGGFGGGTLLSGGGGIRGEIGPVDLQLETAIPIYASGDRSRRNSPQFNFQLGLDL
jgi:hemolysin activation/secretion protein